MQPKIHVEYYSRLAFVLAAVVAVVCLGSFYARDEDPESRIRLASMQMIALPESDSKKVWLVAFAPDRKSLVASTTRFTEGKTEFTIAVADLSKGRFKRFVTEHACHVSIMTFSPNGLWLAVAGAGPQIVLLNGQTFEVKKRIKLNDERDGVKAARFSPDGKLFATLDSSGNIQIWDVATWTERNKLRDRPARTRTTPSIAFSGDGKRLAVADCDYDVAMFSISSGKQLQHYNGQRWGLTNPVIDPTVDVQLSQDGSRLLCAWSGEILRLSEDGTATLTALKHRSDSTWLGVLSDDGSLYVTGSQRGNITIWDASSGKEFRRLSGHKGGVYSLAVSADNSAIASGDGQGNIRIWRIESPARVRSK